MRYALLFPALLFSIFSRAQAPLKADAELTQALVYRSGAALTHKAKLALPEGASEVVICNVANAIDENTIRVSSNANITLLSVKFARDYLKDEVKSPAYTRLEDSITALKQELKQLSIQRQAEQAVLNLLEKNTDLSKSASGQLTEELTRMAEYYKQKQLEANRNIARIDDQIAAQQAAVSKIELQLFEFKTSHSSNSGQIVLQVIAKHAAGTDFNLSYISPNAGWKPLYDLRTDRINMPLNVSYKAQVAQTTGIDWKKTDLTLSTGNPSVNGTAPEPSAWFLSLRHPENSYSYYKSASDRELSSMSVTDAIEGAAPGVQVTNGSGAPGSSASIQVRGRGSLSASSSPLIVLDGAPFSGDIASIDPATVADMKILKDAGATSLYGARGANGVILITTKNQTMVQYTSRQEQALNTTFHIDLPYDIATNGKPAIVNLQEYALPASYQYLAIPRLDGDAFLMAAVTGYDSLNLLPGEGSITFENMYVGKSVVNPGTTNDTLNLSLGRDKQIIIKREQVASTAGTRFLGSSLKQTFTYEIKVRNAKKDTVRLLLKDQFPVSTEKEIEVELLRSDDATVQKESGLLSWQMELAPGQAKTVRVSYSVKSPSGRAVENL